MRVDVEFQMHAKGKLIATGTRVGSLYYLDYLTSCQNVSIAENYQESNRRCSHRCFGHLGVQNLRKLAKNELVSS